LQYVVLVVIVIAGIVIVADKVRQKGAIRARVDTASAVRAALDRPRRALDLETVLNERSRGEATTGIGIWDRLDAELDPGTWRPKLAKGVELRTFELRWGDDYALIASPERTDHYTLDPKEAEIARLMDGTRTVDELIVERLQEDGELDAAAVAGLVEMFRVEGLLEPRSVRVTDVITDRLDPASPGRRKLREFGRSLKIGWSGAERMTEAFYRGGLRVAFRPVGVAVSAALALGGFAAIVATVTSHRFELELRAAPAETVILIALSFVLTFCHELGHALVLVHYRRRVINAGFFIFFGSPAFFVDASDGLMLDRRQRIIQAFGGPWTELVLAGVASLVLFAFPSAGFAPLLYRFAVINYFVIFENLIPLLRLDGYWILTDLIEEPDLRGKSIAFIQRDLWHKLRNRLRFTWQDGGLVIYGVVGVVYSVISFYVGIYFWQALFGDIVADLWNGGIGSRLLLVILFLVFVGPVIRGLMEASRALIRRARAVIAKVRFRIERSWRIEAAELIDELPGFDDLPAEVLSDLAGRVRLRTLPPGRAIFRQGDRPDAFYVVRTGEMAVEDEDPDTGDTRQIRTIGRGEAFGELGLIDMAPRRATLRSLTSTQLFEVDKGTFDRLLVDSIHAPEFGPTMQSFAELRALPPFRRYATDRLEELLEHGEWRTFAPGDSVIEQGAPGDAFFVIGSGQAGVVKDGAEVAMLGPGEFFGELALLNDAPRNATVAARTSLRAFRLDRDGFDGVVAEDFRRGRLEHARTRDMEH
jgi:CRP-like cAMP-binding protein/Zn-dependent protease